MTAAAPQAEVTIYTPLASPFREQLNGETASIGRASDCTIPIKDRYLSRKHAEIVPTDGGWIVRDGDAVIMPRGFHPNVSVPGHPINFVWMMAAHREVEDRQFGVVTVQPGFDQGGSGLEASRK